MSKVRRANNLPFNRSQKLSSNHELHFEGESLSVHLGSVKFAGSSCVPDASVILVDGETAFGIRFEDDGFISIDLTIRDANNRPLLTIRRGELRRSIESWDVTFEGTTLTIKRGPSNVVLRMHLLAPDRVIIDRAVLGASGEFLRIGKACRKGDGVEIANNESGLHRLSFESFGSMLAIGDYLGIEGAAITVPQARRWFGGVPAMPGSFSENGGGQQLPFTNFPYLDAGASPNLSWQLSVTRRLDASRSPPAPAYFPRPILLRSVTGAEG